jgi:hypothetical protein
MSGSESKSERETNGSSPSETDRPSLADFLAPPRPRSSIPAPRSEAESAAEIAAASRTTEPDLPVHKPVAPEPATEAVTATASPPEVPSETSAVGADWAGGADETTPTAPRATSEPAPAVTTAGAAPPPTEARRSLAPTSSTDAAARSLIPVATSTISESAPEPDLEEDFGLPGAGPPWSSATVRRLTYVALLAAAAAVPAWVVFRARSVDVQARGDAAQKAGPAAAGPSTLQPTREIEADEDKDIAAAAPALVPIDPAKALEARREARRLLEAGIIEPGVAAARSAIALNPTDPEAYVLLAAGLQDMGRWAESREVFSRCVHKSKSGINAECAYFANSGTTTNR